MLPMYVNGSYGTLTVCRASGRVLSYDPNEGDGEAAYADIRKVDLAELREHYGKTLVAEYQHWDILDLGFWFETENGQLGYEEPPPDWRDGTVGKAKPIFYFH